MNNIVYRKSIKEDIKQINQLFIEMINTVNNRMKREGFETYNEFENGYEEGYLDNFYIDNNKVIYVALDKDKVVGFISIEKYRESGYIYLDDYCVNNNYRGYGIGTKLMNMALEFAKKEEINNIITHVEKTNTESIKFYKNNHFKIEQEQGHRLLIKRITKEG